MSTQPSLNEKGKLIVFEGIDRAGKTSLMNRLPAALKRCSVPIKTLGEFRSPIKPILKESLRTMTPFLKTFLFAADRAWTYEGECIPALARGDVVLWDRYVDSALVYRSVELSATDSLLDMNLVRDVNRPFKQADLTVYLDISVETSLARARAAGVEEPYNADFLQSARRSYRELALGESYETISGEAPLDTVVGQTATIIQSRFLALFPSE